MALAPGIYWHPHDLPYFITLRDLSQLTEAQVAAPVISATLASEGFEYLLSAVWAPTHADMIAGDWEILATLSFLTTGFHSGEWQVIPEAAKGAEVYIGMVIETQISADDLALGQTELRCR